MQTITNVASVPKLSPFRYPGGKTWLVPQLRRWLLSFNQKPDYFIEPFAGGAISSLTVAMEDLAEHVVFCELDTRIASVWRIILSDADWLCRRIAEFEMNLENVQDILHKEPQNDRTLAFQTIIRNRVQHGGIIASGASLMRAGENGKGIASRWYPSTLIKRIRAIHSIRHRLTFIEGNGFDLIQEYRCSPSAAFFIDPPYTAGGKRAGKRLYTFNEINHDGLFNLARMIQGRFLMTYDVAPEVISLAHQSGFTVTEIPMQNTHHNQMMELLITHGDDRIFGEECLQEECVHRQNVVNWR